MDEHAPGNEHPNYAVLFTALQPCHPPWPIILLIVVTVFLVQCGISLCLYMMCLRYTARILQHIS